MLRGGGGGGEFWGLFGGDGGQDVEAGGAAGGPGGGDQAEDGGKEQEDHQVGDRHHGLGDALLAQRGHQGEAERGADHDPDDGAEDGQDHRLGPDHGADLAAAHADRAQQADLAGALEDREHERVHDPDERDDHGQAEQGVDQAEQLVDVGHLGLLELGPGLDLEVRVGGQGLGDGAVDRGAAGAQQQSGRRPGGIVLGEERRAHHVAADQRVGLVDAADAQRGPAGLGEPGADRVAHGQVVGGGGGGVDEQFAAGQ